MSEECFIRHGENENENDNDNDNDNENENDNKNKIVKDSNIQKLIEEPKEIKSPNWLDKNKFKEILTIIDSNKFVILKKLTLKTWLIILKIIQLVK